MGLDHVLTTSPSSSTSSSSPSVLGEGCHFAIRFSRDGARIAAAAAECVEIWDSCSGGGRGGMPRRQHRLAGHSEIVTNLVWSHHGHGHQHGDGDGDGGACTKVGDFFTCSLDKTIKLWRDCRVVHSFDDHKDWLRSLALATDDATMLSGCVSSTIYGWDVATGRVLFTLPDAHSSHVTPCLTAALEIYTELNTINSLQFMNADVNLFFSGARDGVVKMWDRRDMRHHKSVANVHAHSAKINTLSVALDDRQLLSSARDSTISLWDVRLFTNTTRGDNHESKGGARGPVQQYAQHTCKGYNISSTFFNHDRHIVTGSEDNCVYVYERNSGKMVNRLEGHTSVVHLVDAVDSELKLVSSSIENSGLYVWSPQRKKKLIRPAQPIEEEPDVGEARFLRNHRAAVESLMHKYGEQMLKVFHDHSYTFSSNMSWGALISQVGHDNASADLLSMVNEMATDFARMLDLYRFVGEPSEDDNDNAAATTAMAMAMEPEVHAVERGPHAPPPWRRRQTHQEANEEDRMAEHDRPLPLEELQRMLNQDARDDDSEEEHQDDEDEGEGRDDDDQEDEDEEEDEDEDEDEEEEADEGVRDEPTADERAQERMLRNTLRQLLRAGGGPRTWEHVHQALQLRQAAREQRYEERLRRRHLVVDAGSAADLDVPTRPPDHDHEEGEP